MSNYTIERLILNVTNNFIFLKSDFTGISFNIIGVIGVVLNILFVLGLILVFYSIGDKIRLYFFKVNEDKLNSFINIALGYIIVSTGVSILGIFSILYKNILFVYLIIIILISLYPLSKMRNLARRILFDLSRVLVVYAKSNSFAFWGTVIFVVIAFLRLIPPEIGEDAIGYHTSLSSLYLETHSIIIDPKYSFNLVFRVPQLGEMSYVIAQSVNLKDASRYIHFAFYVLVVLLLAHISSSKGMNRYLGFYAPLLFVTAPVVIQVSSRANADFQWLLCWLLSVFLVTKERLTLRNITLSAILFGGVLATKIWAIAFIPVFLIYLLIVNKNRMQGIRLGSFFLFFSLVVPLLWYIRSYFLTGNPFYPGFSASGDSLAVNLTENIGFNRLMFSLPTLITFSPLFYFGILFLSMKLHSLKRFFSNLFLFFILLFIEHIFLVGYGFSRYLLGIYSLAVLVASIVFRSFFSGNILTKFIFFSIYLALFFYYFTNTILALPYGFGWADKNKYLTRILSWDNSSYYDFGGLFSKWISKNDLVATYGIYGYYYADFSYLDVSAVFSGQNKKFGLLKKKNVSKLLIKGGDINWFCKEVKIEECNVHDTKLLVSYPPDSKKYNLYEIKSLEMNN